jgi:CheY-like chemotaxis protein
MSKVMIVEDDASLREIYGIRIAAEGYTIVSAGDGEEALAVAVREKPDLILSDVMMPKISGFDMLDILRSTPETHDIKVIMMTALSSEDQRKRGEALGANRYLVKSQVGIEDVINAIHEVLAEKGGAVPAAPAETSTVPAAAPAPAQPAPAQPATAPAPAPAQESQQPNGQPTQPAAPAQ